MIEDNEVTKRGFADGLKRLGCKHLPPSLDAAMHFPRFLCSGTAADHCQSRNLFILNIS